MQQKVSQRFIVVLGVLNNISKVYQNLTMQKVLFFKVASKNHNLLINKLQKLGFSGKLLLWVADYLKDRTQRVVLDGSTSEWVPVTSGVPQDLYLVHYCFYSSFIRDKSELRRLNISILIA